MNGTRQELGSKGKNNIDFFEVIPKPEYEKYLERKKKEEYWTFQADFSSATVNPRGTTTTASGMSTPALDLIGGATD